jgi:Zn-dependent protease
MTTAATRAAGANGVSAIFWLLVAAFALSGARLAAGDGGGLTVFIFVFTGWIISLCLHEWAHAYVAYRGGDDSVIGRGYLTLNPLRYVNPLMSIGLPLLFLAMGGIGFPGGAVYVHPERLPGAGWRAAMSAAGPAMNFASLLLIGLVIAGLDATISTPFGAALALLAFLQATALLLNLLPVPGLDGFGILQAVLPASANAAIASIGRFITILFLAVMVGAPHLLQPLWDAALALCEWFGIQPNAIRSGFDLFRFWTHGASGFN